jgi:putative membrane protein
MLWFLVLHIIALLLWSAALLYLPALIAGSAARRVQLSEPQREHDSVARFFFTHLATPPAIVAIFSGTVVFLLEDITDVWLIAKLTLVTGLVVCHALAGVLVIRAEAPEGKSVQPWCWLLGGALALQMTAIVWLVLAKPAIELNL